MATILSEQHFGTVVRAYDVNLHQLPQMIFLECSDVSSGLLGLPGTAHSSL